MLLTKIKTDTHRITLPSIEDVPGEYWAKLAEKRIFFGHQSVGYNILDGMINILDEYNHIKLNIVETNEAAKFDRPIFAHSQVGRNTDPASKIKSFINIMDSGVGNKVDIAFFKFCYVDIMRDSNPREIFDTYNAAIDDLKERYPRVMFMHVAVPLCSTPVGAERKIKENIKLLIGKPGLLDDNINRNLYNRMLNETYSETEPVFDLALLESVNPDGFRSYVNKGSEKVFLMSPQYTNDGGHLKSEYRKRIAEQLLIILAEAANKPS
jgi:hypothetical protein